jgi:hypothetical protein
MSSQMIDRRNLVSTASEATTGGLIGGVFGYLSGRYYPMCAGLGSSSSLTVTANRLYAVPFETRKYARFTGFAFEVTTLAAGTARAGIYDNDVARLAPGSLIRDFGTADTGSAAVKIIEIDDLLAPGEYWLALVFSATPAVRRPTASANGAMPLQTIGWTGFPDGSNGEGGGVWIAFTYDVLPAQFPQGGSRPGATIFPTMALVV